MPSPPNAPLSKPYRAMHKYLLHKYLLHKYLPHDGKHTGRTHRSRCADTLAIFVQLPDTHARQSVRPSHLTPTGLFRNNSRTRTKTLISNRIKQPPVEVGKSTQVETAARFDMPSALIRQQTELRVKSKHNGVCDHPRLNPASQLKHKTPKFVHTEFLIANLNL